MNRPGRFHYHFRFEYPSAEEIRTYLYDKLDESRHDEIERIIAFSRKVDLNYDCLRAIAFEINNGESFQGAVCDLNIINLAQECYDITMYFKNGSPMSVKNKQVDFFLDEEISMCFSGDDYNEILTVGFWIRDSTYDVKSNCAIISADKLHIRYDEDYEEIYVEKIKELVPDHLAIKKVREKSLHYAV